MASRRPAPRVTDTGPASTVALPPSYDAGVAADARRALDPAPAAVLQACTANTRTLTIIAKDPGVTIDGRPIFAEVEVPAEALWPGPTGYRVKVIDFDGAAEKLYVAEAAYDDAAGNPVDPFGQRLGESDDDHAARLLANPNFHAQNAYVIVMRTLARFEYALGRRVAWGFDGHQLHVAPHAFCDANACYSEVDQGLFLGYFIGSSGATIFTCLSHDIVAHETTHALLDGLRDHFTDLSSPDQAAFHEAFADIVALLSVFALPEVVARILSPDPLYDASGEVATVAAEAVTIDALAASVLTGLAEQTGHETAAHGHGGALRQSVKLPPGTHWLDTPEFEEEHRRGEVLVAATIRAFLTLWCGRIKQLGTFGGRYSCALVVEEGAKAADHLLTMAIRAIDYCPPTDIDFPTYLAALLTADAELVPDDRKHGYRATIREVFASYGIAPPARDCHATDGTWLRFDDTIPVTYGRSNFDSMLRDKDEVFRFLWENRIALGIAPRNAAGRFLDDPGRIDIASVRPAVRQGPDGFFLKETVCEYVVTAQMFGSEVEKVLGVKRPRDMKSTERVEAFGGGVLIFDQYGRIKYHIVHRLDDGERQQRRLDYLWARGVAGGRGERRNDFAAMHRLRQGA